MSDTPQQPQREPNRPLSEIGHLFLSSIRDRQTNGASRPIRKGPGPSNGQATGQSQASNIDPNVSIDLTPEEFAEVYGKATASDEADPRPQVAAVIATHLNGRQVDRTREYAAHLASTHGRVGLIEIDAAEFRVTLFERHADENEAAGNAANDVIPEPFSARRMTEALEELSWDVDRWLLLLPNPRTAECRALLNDVQKWTLLATCDHDGMVSCYRTLKGLAGTDKTANRPEMSLALLDVRSLDEADRVTLKLTSVCDQFLNWKLENESVVKPALNVSAHPVVCCRATRDTVGTPQFDVVREFITRSKTSKQEVESVESPSETAAIESASFESPAIAPATVEMKMPEITNSPKVMITGASDVIDLVGDDANPLAVVSAFVKGPNGLIDTPIKAPMCPAASLAVARDRKLVLVAVASEGLCDLNAIGSAYRWLCENRTLIAMALPQFAIEPTHSPRLQLLIDQADLSAAILQPLLKSEHVTVQTYRKLRWGGKTGLLLEAA